MKPIIAVSLIISLLFFSGCTKEGTDLISKRDELKEKKERLEREINEVKALKIERDQAKAELNYIESQIEQMKSLIPPKEDQ